MWGAALSAHKVEGEDFASDWWRWEQGTGRIRDGSTSQHAAGHLAQAAEDVALAAKLGLNALLYAVSWARIETKPGLFDAQALSHYRKLFESLREQGVEPVVVLWDVAAPLWFTERGGWTHPDAAKDFLRFTEQAVEAFGGCVRWWVPLWEPLHWMRMAFGEGCWPLAPSVRRWGVGARPRALRQLLRAQEQGYARIKQRDSSFQVGMAVRVGRTEPADPHSPWDLRVANVCSTTTDAMVLSREGAYDFVCLCHCGRRRVRCVPWLARRLGTRYVTGDGARTDADYALPAPDALGESIRHYGRQGKPLFVVANGLATDSDAERAAYLLDHLHAASQACAAGADIRGYFQRSFLDGFEWHWGYARRFGLVHVDWETRARTPNPSAFLYRDIVKAGEIQLGTAQRYVPGWAPPKEVKPPWA